MPLVSDDFVSALGQFFPRAGEIYRQNISFELQTPELELSVITVPDDKVLRVTSFNNGTNQHTGYCQYFHYLYVNGELLTGEFANADFSYELLPGDDLTIRRTCTSASASTYTVTVTGYFLDYTP
jgi:hypothetical protein